MDIQDAQDKKTFLPPRRKVRKENLLNHGYTWMNTDGNILKEFLIWSLL